MMRAFRSSRTNTYSYSTATACLLVSILEMCAFAAAPGKPDSKPEFTILFTAEAHAELLPCDCPLEPFGGVTRRATVINRYRKRGPVLLVDAGGWAAGGLYDESTDGDTTRDALRTRLMAESMASMKYDALAWGEEEWPWRMLNPIFNPRSRAGPVMKEFRDAFVYPLNGWAGIRKAPADPPYPTRLGKRVNNIDVEIYAFSRPKEGVKLVDGLAKNTAFEEIKKPLPQTGFRLGLCPLGEENTERLAKAAKGFDLLINAGRKSTGRVSWHVGDTVVANFDYHVQRMGVAEIFRLKNPKVNGGGPRWRVRVRHEPIRAKTPEEPGIASILKPHMKTLEKKGKRRVTIEYWTMGYCPYCKSSRPAIEKVANELSGKVSLEPHFLVGKNAQGAFRALHGRQELMENRVQALVHKYYPKKFWDWQRWREAKGNRLEPWEKGARALGILVARIRGALRMGEADEILERDYRLALRRRVIGTPSLVIANRMYDGPLDRMNLLRVLCGLLEKPKPGICATVPACFHDAQCSKRGFIGRCLDKGTPKARCDFSRKAVAVKGTVIMERDPLWTNHESILKVLLGYLPGLKWEVVRPGTHEGKALMTRHKIELLPAYLLDPIAKTEVGFDENLGRSVSESSGQLLVSGRHVGARRIAERERVLGRAELFVARFTKSGQQAVDVALETLADPSRAPELKIHDIVHWRETTDHDGKVKRELAAPGGIAEIEEAAIGLAVREVAPDKYHAYLKARGKRRASLFWDRALREAGIDVEKVRALAEGPADVILKKLHAVAGRLKELDTGGKVVLLGENCELIPVRSRADLRHYLERIARRKKE